MKAVQKFDFDFCFRTRTMPPVQFDFSPVVKVAAVIRACVNPLLDEQDTALIKDVCDVDKLPEWMQKWVAEIMKIMQKQTKDVDEYQKKINYIEITIVNILAEFKPEELVPVLRTADEHEIRALIVNTGKQAVMCMGAWSDLEWMNSFNVCHPEGLLKLKNMLSELSFWMVHPSSQKSKMMAYVLNLYATTMYWFKPTNTKLWAEMNGTFRSNMKNSLSTLSEDLRGSCRCPSPISSIMTKDDPVIVWNAESNKVKNNLADVIRTRSKWPYRICKWAFDESSFMGENVRYIGSPMLDAELGFDQMEFLIGNLKIIENQ
jgi:hypothetical protein